MLLTYYNIIILYYEMGIDFIDTVVVRRSINKGTKTEHGPVKRSDFMGESHKKYDDERLKLAGDLWIMSGKGTKKIRLSEMEKAKPLPTKGFYISTGKGTSRLKI